MAQLPRREEERRLAAADIREQATEVAAERPHGIDDNNGDEVSLPRFIGNFSKGLEHDQLGDPEPRSYGTLLRALESRDPQDFNSIDLGPGGKKFTNPQAGLAFNLAGPDSQELSQPPAPSFASAVTAAEMGELYWMAVARDVPFIEYFDNNFNTSNPRIAAAVASMNSEFSQFGGRTPVTPKNLFRGVHEAEARGPYVSQFLIKGNSDPRKMDGMGRNADEGYIAYGARVIDQRQQTVQPGMISDYLTDFNTWLAVQNGADLRGGDHFDFTQRRFIRSLRDGANFVHFDLTFDAYFNAAWILASEPMGTQNVANAGAVPMRDREFPFNPGNPYNGNPTQVGFATFGDPHVFEVLLQAIGLAQRQVWWQKWGVHRRLRPEEYGGRVQNEIEYRETSGGGGRSYPGIDWETLITSLRTGGLSPYFGGQEAGSYPTYLLPQAFPEGAPTHPAYGAGHATVSGAAVTILKAFFDESKVIENPMVPNADGTALVPYTAADAGQMTVGTELNKLSSNISLFRNAAGVHWRSDDTQSRLLGEKVAIRLLQELTLTYNEDNAFFELRTFQGQPIRIANGLVDFVTA